MPTVFLSYSRKDRDFVDELHRRLVRDGVSCFLDTEDIRWGDQWPSRLESAIRECEFFVPVLSADYLGSRWSGKERDAAEASGRTILPLLLDACEIPPFLAATQTVDVSTDERFEAEYPRICRALGGEPAEAGPPRFVRGQLPPVAPSRENQRVPFPSLYDRFIGRTADLWALHDSLCKEDGVAVITGTGGLGKTQLAVEYARRFAPDYPGGICWVSADEGLPALVPQVSSAAGIELDGKLSLAHQLQELWSKLSRKPAYLLILDNLPEDKPIQPWLPHARNVRTIVTTRKGVVPTHERVRLQPLTEEQGAALLNSGDRRFGTEAESLSSRLGGLPLALELSRAYLGIRTDLTIPDLIQEMDTAGEIEVLSAFAREYGDELPDGHELDVAKTIDLSWGLTAEGARDVLRAMSHLAPVPVPRRLLRTALGLPEGAKLSDPLAAALTELQRLSLVDSDAVGEPSAHRLLLCFVRRDSRQPEFLARVVAAVTSEMRRTTDEKDTASYRELERVLPHAERLLDAGKLSTDEAIDLGNYSGGFHKRHGRYALAAAARLRALRRATRDLPAGHEQIAACQSDLAVVYRYLGKFEDARILLEQAVVSDAKNLGAGHPDCAANQSNLALVYQDLGRLDDARVLLEKALASDETNFGPGHPFTANDQSNLGLVYKDLGRLDEARDLLEKALAADEKNFGPDHPMVAIRQSSLGAVYKSLNRLDDARELLEKALASDERNLGPDHPDVAIRQSNLADVYRDLGRLDEARDLLEKALAIAERALPPDHPRTRLRRSNLAELLEQLPQKRASAS